MFAVRSACIALLAVCLSPLQASAKWTKVHSAHFVFLGDASERDIREVAQNLEQFRETLIRALGEGASRTPVPTVVFVFASDQSFTPYKPHFRGKPIELGGYFHAAEHINYIALVPNRERDDYRVTFHEYTHFVVNNMMGSLPLWLDEGLAEYYETFESHNSGRVAIIGRPSALHIEALRGRAMPLTELMAIDRSSPVYNEGKRRGIFYAQSWALVHYLIGNPARAGQLSAYLAEIRAGALPAAAFSSAFKTDTAVLEEELQTYLRRFLFPAVQFTFAEKFGDGGVQRGTRIPDSEAHAYLAELVAATGRPDEAKLQLERVLEATPLAPRALSALGAIELGAGNIDTGISLLERAAESAPEDSWVQSVLGRALADRLWDARGDREAHEATLSRARTILSKAVGLPPASASTLVALALVELEGNNLQRARSLLEDASRMAPAREPYRALLAQVLMSQGEFDAADAILGPLAAAGTRHEVREDARSLLVRVATLRLRSVARADPMGARGAPASGPVVPSPVAGAQPTASDTPESLSETAARPKAGRLVLNLRAVRPGETRVRAEFQAVDCTAAGIVLRVRVNGRLLRFAAVHLTDIDFVSFRSDTPPSVVCGSLSPVSALLTYRPSPPVLAHLKAEGEVVALELIPQDYVPRHP